MSDRLRPIILAGGSGKRLWPLSTEERPKQFISIFKDFSLFDLTLQRLNKRSLFKKPIIVTSEKYLDFVNESLLRTGIKAKKIILEPEGKNTYPAVTMAVMLALKNNPSEDFFISPSDHYISVNKKFHDSCSLSRDQIKKDALILMGIKPDRPSVEYGYISIEKSSQEVKRVLDFIEKPNLAKSKELISQSNVYWNGGMFIFNGLWFIKQLKKFDKKMYTDISDIVSSGLHTSNIFIPDKSKFKNIKKISFDSAFVEKNDKTLMTILDAGWSDLGSWVSLGALQRDPDNAMTISTENVYERLVKPWGFFEILMETLTSKVKLLSVSPGERLSLQRHEHRMETWYIVKGTAKVTRGVERFTLQVGDSIIIEKNQIHRLENDSEENLEVIEIQTGNYFGEDDIVRIEDSYGRAGLH